MQPTIYHTSANLHLLKSRQKSFVHALFHKMWNILIFAIALFAISKYLSLFKGYENVERMFPGPPRIPIFGNIFNIFGGDPHFIYNCTQHWSSLYRRSIRFWAGPVLWIFISTPEEAEALLNNPTHIKKSSFYHFITPWIGGGLITSDGEKWKVHRKTLTPAFHFKILETYFNIILDNSKIFCSKLEAQIGLPSYDVVQDIKAYAIDNICETSMGTSIKAQENPDSEYVQAVKLFLHTGFLRLVNPWLLLDPIFYLTKHGQNYKKALKCLHGFAMDVIEKRIKERQRDKINSNGEMSEISEKDLGVKKKKVFLDILLDAYDEKILTVLEVREEVDTFIFAGHDTITAAFGFLFYLLSENQNEQEKVYQELLDIFGDDNRDPTNEDLTKMKYMEMVIKETLRLYPSVPIYARHMESDLKLDKNTVIPKGAEVGVLTSGIHRDPRHWEKPEEFYPDHFLPETVAKRHPYAFIPFSAGPRNCIGFKLAMMEMKTTLCQVLRKLKLLPSSPKMVRKLMLHVILECEGGIKISIEKRLK